MTVYMYLFIDHTDSLSGPPEAAPDDFGFHSKACVGPAPVRWHDIAIN